MKREIGSSNPINDTLISVPNKYRVPLPLVRFRSDRPPSTWLARHVGVGTEMVADLPGGRIVVQFSLLGISAN